MQAKCELCMQIEIGCSLTRRQARLASISLVSQLDSPGPGFLYAFIIRFWGRTLGGWLTSWLAGWQTGKRRKMNE